MATAGRMWQHMHALLVCNRAGVPGIDCSLRWLMFGLPLCLLPHSMREAQAASGSGSTAATAAAAQQPASKKQKSGTAAWKAGVGYGHRWGPQALRGLAMSCKPQLRLCGRLVEQGAARPTDLLLAPEA